MRIVWCGPCFTCVFLVMDARGKLGQHERSALVARGEADCFSRFSNALTNFPSVFITRSTHNYIMNLFHLEHCHCHFIQYLLEKMGYVGYTKWQWALSCVTKNATMYCHYETMNDGTSLGISSITQRNTRKLIKYEIILNRFERLYYWFACDVIAAMLVYNNNRVVITFFCCVHQRGRHTLCHLNPWRLSANQELVYLQHLLSMVLGGSTGSRTRGPC